MQNSVKQMFSKLIALPLMDSRKNFANFQKCYESLSQIIKFTNKIAKIFIALQNYSLFLNWRNAELFVCQLHRKNKARYETKTQRKCYVRTESVTQ